MNENFVLFKIRSNFAAVHLNKLMKKGGGIRPCETLATSRLWKRFQIQSALAEKISWIDILVLFFIGALRNSNNENEYTTRFT